MVTLLLVAVTLGFFLGTDRFDVQSADLIANQDDWHFKGDAALLPDGSFQLRNQSPESSSALLHEIDVPPSRLIRLSADIAVQDVRQGPRFWQLARIDLEGKRVSADAKWEWMPGTKLFAETGSTSFQAERVMSIAPEYARVRVACDLTGATGTMIIQNLTAFAVSERQTYQNRRGLLAGLWLIVALIAALDLWRRQLKIELVATAICAIVLFLTPGWARGWIYPLDEILHFSIEHTALFLLLSLYLLARMRPAVSPAIVIGYLVCIAIASETAQWFTPTRGPSLIDAMSNIIGILAGLLLWWTHRTFLHPTMRAPRL